MSDLSLRHASERLWRDFSTLAREAAFATRAPPSVAVVRKKAVFAAWVGELAVRRFACEEEQQIAVVVLRLLLPPRNVWCG
jgi:hypothetical protein